MIYRRICIFLCHEQASNLTLTKLGKRQLYRINSVLFMKYV
jgi:hypothetical protein